MGARAHIISGHIGFEMTAASRTVASAGPGRRTGLWRQFERELIDRRAILAEHPLQSRAFQGFHMTITGMRYNAGM
jgi:hypothetical protein